MMHKRKQGWLNRPVGGQDVGSMLTNGITTNADTVIGLCLLAYLMLWAWWFL